MKKLYLITGFSNWGKSRAIMKLFDKKSFVKNRAHLFRCRKFGVLSRSNDDDGIDDFLKNYKELVGGVGDHVDHILAAFCPRKAEGRETRSSLDIIDNMVNHKKWDISKIYIIPIEYKWCDHAKLNIEEIKSYYKTGHKHVGLIDVHPQKGSREKVGDDKYYGDLRDLIENLL